MQTVLGLDQGATKTMAAVAAADGTILAAARAGGGYHAVTGMRHAMGQMKQAAEQAAAGLPNQAFAAVAAGATGADFPYEYRLLEKEIGAVFGISPVVVNDCMIALRAETDAANSLIICAGSGLNIALRAPDGREFVFGFYIDDCAQGGGAIGRKAMRAVVEGNIGLYPPTRLTQQALQLFNVPDIPALMEYYFGKAPSRDVAKELALAVDRCAAGGDEVAQNILREFGEDCARYAAAGIRSYGMCAEPVRIYLSGSIFKSASTLLRDTITSGIRGACPAAQVVDSRFEPIVGGVLLALEQLHGGRLPETVKAQVAATAARHNLLRRMP